MTQVYTDKGPTASWTGSIVATVGVVLGLALVLAAVAGRCDSIVRRPTVSINSYPPGATVYVDGKLQLHKKTPARLRLTNGEYNIELRLPLYPPLARHVVVNVHKIVENYDFAFQVPLHVATQPESAEVIWDDMDLGMTPLDSVEVDAKPDPMPIVLRHSGFTDRPLRGSLNLSTGASTGGAFLDVRSDTTSGRLRWVVDGVFYTICSLSVTPRDGQIALDGRALVLSDGAVTCSLGYGEHRVTAGRGGFQSQSASVNVNCGQELVRKFRLVREVAVHVFDSVPEPDVEVSSAAITVDGQTVSEGAPFRLPPGDYELSIGANGFESALESMVVTTTSPSSYTVYLRRGPPSLRVYVASGLGDPLVSVQVWARSSYGEETDLNRTGTDGSLETSLSEGSYEFATQSQSDTAKVWGSATFEVKWPRAEVLLTRGAP